MVDYFNKWRKTNIIDWFHPPNTLLFFVYVSSKQSNALKHSFYNLFIYLFLLFPTSVGNFEHICDDIFIKNNLLHYPNINCFFCQVLRNSTNRSWCGVLWSISRKPTNPTLNAHLFFPSPIFTHVVIISNSQVYDYSMGVNINLYGSSESTNLLWQAILFSF